MLTHTQTSEVAPCGVIGTPVTCSGFDQLITHNTFVAKVGGTKGVVERWVILNAGQEGVGVIWEIPIDFCSLVQEIASPGWKVYLNVTTPASTADIEWTRTYVCENSYPACGVIIQLGSKIQIKPISNVAPGVLSMTVKATFQHAFTNNSHVYVVLIFRNTGGVTAFFKFTSNKQINHYSLTKAPCLGGRIPNYVPIAPTIVGVSRY